MHRPAILLLFVAAMGASLAAEARPFRAASVAVRQAGEPRQTAWRRNMVRRISPYAYFDWLAAGPEPVPALPPGQGWPRAGAEVGAALPSPPPLSRPASGIRRYTVCEC